MAERTEILTYWIYLYLYNKAIPGQTVMTSTSVLDYNIPSAFQVSTSL